MQRMQPANNSSPPHLPEILAPAGSAPMLSAAVLSGADAVYLGLDGFNARRSAGNFTPQALSEAVCFCRARGVRVHVTLNTLVYACELPELEKAIFAVAESGADAVIVDDLATATLIKQIAPGLALHGSTQMSVHTAAGVRALAELGFSRAILARELSLSEIAAITAQSPIETEVFVHGALCLSMSGQCMMSAFLGGRSGNRGACAGPCRLPFDANPLRVGQPGQASHLSLKDLDLLPWLPKLAAAGVASFKIEGRLRTPEYAAAAVAACRLAEVGEPFDAQLLQDIFSRSGFTDGYLTGHIGRQMFGVRTAQDAAVTRAAAPKARELYRRELSRVPVRFTLALSADGAKLTAEDNAGHRAFAYHTDPLPPARTDPAEALARSLEKTGGTPFCTTREAIALQSEGGPWFLPGSAANELRRQALESLLSKRSAPAPLPTHPAPAFSFVPRAAVPAPCTGWILRAETAAALPVEALLALPEAQRPQFLVLPLAQAPLLFGVSGQKAVLPDEWRSRLLFELPRAMFGALEGDTAAGMAAAAAGPAFGGFVANNLAHLALWQACAPKQSRPPLYGGLGLNLTNPLAAAEWEQLGLSGLLIHPETPFSAARFVAAPKGSIPTALLAYGHLPLMLTRACPLQNVHDCNGCAGAGSLRDRKARDFAVRCARGMRTIYNPVPLYLGDRRAEIPADYAVLAFTTEPPERAAEVLRLFLAGAPFDGEFTRGLYYKEISG